jgi:hypothetical protein
VCSSRTRTTLYRCTRTCAVTRCTEVNKIILSYNNSMRRRSCGGTRIYTRVQYSSIFCTSGNRYESTFVLPYFVLIYTYVTHTFVRVQLQDTCTRRGTNYTFMSYHTEVQRTFEGRALHISRFTGYFYLLSHFFSNSTSALHYCTYVKTTLL